jgi:hypothetical protein
VRVVQPRVQQVEHRPAHQVDDKSERPADHHGDEQQRAAHAAGRRRGARNGGGRGPVELPGGAARLRGDTPRRGACSTVKHRVTTATNGTRLRSLFEQRRLGAGHLVGWLRFGDSARFKSLPLQALGVRSRGGKRATINVTTARIALASTCRCTRHASAAGPAGRDRYPAGSTVASALDPHARRHSIRRHSGVVRSRRTTAG